MIEPCTYCRINQFEYRFCSSKKALLIAKEGEDYKILNEHVKHNPVTGYLEAKYSFVKYPAVLLENGAEAKSMNTGTHG